ncbi:MAG TPA: patatin-like phospholipase family protein [Burkholderiales bacterium]|nr:patatin-like phospholipase family protein [Burkholderiales bacterium]
MCWPTFTLCAGCTTLYSYSNEPLRPPEPAAGASLRIGPPLKGRATFAVDGRRGNDRVLFFLALSGGGSRAAHLAEATMLKLQTVYDDVDLLREVDVMSSVSGGSLPAAYYAVSRDQSLPLTGALAPLAAAAGKTLPAGKLTLDAKSATLTCSAPLDPSERQLLRAAFAEAKTAAERVVELCEQAQLTNLRPWNPEVARNAMTRNYVARWMGNWFRPNNIVLYWFTAYNRADIMAQTFQNNLYDRGFLGFALTFQDINPQRPYLIINSTNTTEQAIESGPLADPYAFGSVFTFTEEDFRTRVNSPIATYSIARAVAASSAFPVVFPYMTLRDFRTELVPECAHATPAQAESCERYVHMFDGGNSDNLGLKSVKRALFELAVAGELDNYDRVVVLLVDAFTKPRGTSRLMADPRKPFDRLLDTNVIEAVDALLQENRGNRLEEFKGAVLRWSADCEPDKQNLPPALCAKLAKLPKGELDLQDKLVFYHFGFEDVEDANLRRELNQIPTSFNIDDKDVENIDRAVQQVLTPDNACLRQIRAIVRGESGPAAAARKSCEGIDKPYTRK